LLGLVLVLLVDESPPLPIATERGSGTFVVPAAFLGGAGAKDMAEAAGGVDPSKLTSGGAALSDAGTLAPAGDVELTSTSAFIPPRTKSRRAGCLFSLEAMPSAAVVD
jgi:hypothetical protein